MEGFPPFSLNLTTKTTTIFIKIFTMSTFLLILHIIISLVLLVSLAKIVKSLYKAVKNKNTAGIIYGLILLVVGLIIFYFVLDYKRFFA